MRADPGKAPVTSPTPSLAGASPGDEEINARRVHVHFDEIPFHRGVSRAPLSLSLSLSFFSRGYRNAICVSATRARDEN